MPQTTIGRGNELYDWLVQPATLTWSGTVGATSAAELTATLQGVNAGDCLASFDYNPPSGTAITTALPYGLSANNFRIVSANTISVLWTNTTAGALTPPAGPWYINIVRPENPNNLPVTAA